MCGYHVLYVNSIHSSNIASQQVSGMKEIVNSSNLRFLVEELCQNSDYQFVNYYKLSVHVPASLLNMFDAQHNH